MSKIGEIFSAVFTFGGRLINKSKGKGKGESVAKHAILYHDFGIKPGSNLSELPVDTLQAMAGVEVAGIRTPGGRVMSVARGDTWNTSFKNPDYLKTLEVKKKAPRNNIISFRKVQA